MSSSTERVSEVHVLHDAYPYTVESVPLSFGASQLTKATATFHYTKHHVVYNDISNWNWISGSTPSNNEEVRFYDDNGNYIGDQLP